MASFSAKWYYEQGMKQPKRGLVHDNCDTTATLLFKHAAKLGHIGAHLILCGEYMPFSRDHLYWYYRYVCLVGLTDTYQRYKGFREVYSTGSRSLIVYAGWLLRYEKLLQDSQDSLDSQNSLISIKKCVKYYQNCRDQTRSSVIAFTLCAKRLGVVRDVRLLISQLVWETRLHGLYPL